MLLQLLQVPGGTELLIILIIALFLFVVTVGLTIWVYNDAKERGDDNAVIWAIATFAGLFILGPLGLVVPIAYLVAGRE